MDSRNKVNQLEGKDWLRNSVNFYEIEDYDEKEIEKRFIDFCFKKRTTGKKKLLNSNYNIDDYDFTIQKVDRFDDIKPAMDLIYYSSYDSYHIVLLENEIIDGSFLTKSITSLANDYQLEYRGKIVIHSIKQDKIVLALMFLNRVNKDDADFNPDKHDSIKFQIKESSKKPFVINSYSKMDKIGLKHPAPYSYIDINKICEIENINNKRVLDPFLGVGSTILGTFDNSNYNIGIELNPEYVDLTKQRFELLDFKGKEKDNYTIINGDCLKAIDDVSNFDTVITSPPYFNILKNKNKGVRHDNSQSRQGVDFYSELIDDIGNLDEYDAYLNAIGSLFSKIYNKLPKGGKVYLIISDFTINKKEKDIHSDMTLLLSSIGFTYNTTSYLYQSQKVIYPFGYPFKIVLNHIYQYVIIFEK